MTAAKYSEYASPQQVQRLATVENVCFGNEAETRERSVWYWRTWHSQFKQRLVTALSVMNVHAPAVGQRRAQTPVEQA